MTKNEPEVYNYKAYLRGKYLAERYNTEQEIANAITGGKVFLFRSTFGLLASTWGFFVLGCCYIAWAIWATIDTGLWTYLGDLFTPAGAWLWILWGLALVFFLLARSQFVIVGPRGIVWREWGTLQALPWQKVAGASAWLTKTTHYTASGNVTSGRWSARIDTIAGHQHKIEINYLNREYHPDHAGKLMAKTIALCWEYFRH